MADDLTVTAGGSTSVVLGELWEEAARLGVAEARCADWADRVDAVRIDMLGSRPVGPAGGPVVESPTLAVERAWFALRDMQDDARDLRFALDTASSGYGDVERMVASMWELGSRLGAHVFADATGFGAGVTASAVLGGAPFAMSLLIAGAIGGAWDPGATGRRILADPAFIDVIRTLPGTLDESALMAVGIAPPIARLLGARTRTPDAAAAALTAAAALGVLGSRALVEGPVSVVPATSAPNGAAKMQSVPPPIGVGELARRIPSPNHDEPQIAVERYDVDGERRFVVYVSGTVTFDPEPGGEPFDLTNDVYGVADDGLTGAVGTPESTGAAERAVRQALAEAGAEPGDPVMPVGFSAGGITAADLARAPDLAVPLAVTFGAPSGAASTGDVPVLSIEHVEDLVPATGGIDSGASGFARVTRRVFDDDGDHEPLASHSLELYRQTGALVDGNDDPVVLAFEARIVDFTGGASGRRSEWLATREPPT